MKNKKNIINYIIIAAVLIIPFMYSFFYLKAYWDPYGKGNVDNIPVAIVNEDKGKNGEELINSIIDSGKLKISVVGSKEAEDGLYDKNYYAVITIPSDFTESMESASTNNKRHATITYSPNQKSNFLASQIINSVVNAVEKNLDNKVNSAIVSGLTDSVLEVPDSLETISSGFSKLQVGTDKLENGSDELKIGALDLYNGTTNLKNGTITLASGIKELQKGSYKLKEGSSSLLDGTYKLKNGIAKAYDGSKTINDTVNSKINSLENDNSSSIDNATLTYIKNQAVTGATNKVNQIFTDTYKNNIGLTAVNNSKELLKSQLEAGLQAQGVNITVDIYCTGLGISDSNCIIYNGLNDNTSAIYKLVYNTAISSSYQAATNTATLTADNVSESVAIQVATTAKETATIETVKSLKNLSAGLNELTTGLNELKNGSVTLYNGVYSVNEGASSLYEGSTKLQIGALTLSDGTNKLNGGAQKLSTGTNTLTSGIKELNSSVKSAKDELDSNIKTTKEEVKKVETLAEYAENPVIVKNETVNEISSYGTAFSPLFISIGLWVGCLMMYVVLYYDKASKFGLLDKEDKHYVKRTLAYHVLATLSGIVLGFALQLLLDFEITNILLYYLSIVLIANMFVAIIDFLIVNFDDIGKFLALIILVLQLAAAGGTFPIETVTKGFRFLNNFLPMTYTINLLKEVLVSIESSLLIKNLIIVIILFIVFFVFNILNGIRKEKKEK